MDLSLNILYNKPNLRDILLSLNGARLVTPRGYFSDHYRLMGFDSYVSFEVILPDILNISADADKVLQSISHLLPKILVQVCITMDSEFHGKHAVLARFLYQRMNLINELSTDEINILHEVLESKML